MSDVCKCWVLCYKPFDPSGIFISQVDYSKKPPVKAGSGLGNAQRFLKAEIPFILDQIAEYMNTSRLVPVDLGDHFFN